MIVHSMGVIHSMSFRLWNFKDGGSLNARFLPKNQHAQILQWIMVHLKVRQSVVVMHCCVFVFGRHYVLEIDSDRLFGKPLPTAIIDVPLFHSPQNYTTWWKPDWRFFAYCLAFYCQPPSGFWNFRVNDAWCNHSHS